MPVRSADAAWEGQLKEGSGQMRLGSGAYEGPYSFQSRFGDGNGGTNPEELVGAALAGCFSMALANDLDKAGHTPQRVATTADVHLSQTESGGFGIPRIDLRCEADADTTQEELQRIAEGTKRNCPISQLVTGAQITLEIKLSG